MPYADHPDRFDEERLPGVVDGWFDAMAALERVAPWDAGVDPRRPLYVTMDGSNLHDAVLHPLGRGGGRRGFALFTAVDDLDAWLEREADGGPSRDAPGLYRLEIAFEKLADAHPAVRRELERRDRGLGDAVPSAWVVDDEGTSRPAGVNELEIAEAVAVALVDALEAADGALLAAWRGGEPASRTIEDAGAGALGVELRTHPLSPETTLPAAELIEALRRLDGEHGWGENGERRYLIERRLDRRFRRSPEAAHLERGHGYWLTFVQWAGSHVGRTLATLDADGVEEVVFDIVPRKVSADASESGPFIEAVRALYRWLGREYGLPQAQDCLAVLDAPDAVPRLEALMSDPGNFDPAKGFYMEAIALGIDPRTPEGAMRVNEMRAERAAEARALAGIGADLDPYGTGSRARQPLDPAVRKKREAKRKADRKSARKARKKSR